MKTNHEMLKEICDEIGYSLLQNGFNIDTNILGGGINKIISKSQSVGQRDEREIIFTQEFIDKFINTFLKLNGNLLKTCQNIDDTLLNLDNPTLYLYNTLGLGQKKENN